MTFVVKKYPGGPMSEHLHDMQPGDTLDMKGPIPKYPWTANKHDHVALLAGGTGITPMYQLARGIFKNPDDKTKVTLVFGNVTEADILLKEEWEKLENEYPNRMRAFYLLDQPPKEWSQYVFCSVLCSQWNQALMMTQGLRPHHQGAPPKGDPIAVRVQHQGVRLRSAGTVQGHQWQQEEPV